MLRGNPSICNEISRSRMSHIHACTNGHIGSFTCCGDDALVCWTHLQQNPLEPMKRSGGCAVDLYHTPTQLDPSSFPICLTTSHSIDASRETRVASKGGTLTPTWNKVVVDEEWTRFQNFHCKGLLLGGVGGSLAGENMENVRGCWQRHPLDSSYLTSTPYFETMLDFFLAQIGNGLPEKVPRRPSPPFRMK